MSAGDRLNILDLLRINEQNVYRLAAAEDEVTRLRAEIRVADDLTHSVIAAREHAEKTLIRERDEARAEVERLREERDALSNEVESLDAGWRKAEAANRRVRDLRLDGIKALNDDEFSSVRPDRDDVSWLVTEVERLRAAMADAYVDYEDDLREARAEIGGLRARIERVQKQREKFRSDVDGMPNTIISRRAKRHVLAALDGAR